MASKSAALSRRMPLRLNRILHQIRQWPVLCVLTSSLLGILLLADFVTQIASTTSWSSGRDTGLVPWLRLGSSQKLHQDERLSMAQYLEVRP